MLVRTDPGAFVRMVIKPAYRNAGYSYGLEFPFIHGQIESRWRVWNRHTGEVVFTGDVTTWDSGFRASTKECLRLNDIIAHDHLMNVLHDLEA